MEVGASRILEKVVVASWKAFFVSCTVDAG